MISRLLIISLLVNVACHTAMCLAANSDTQSAQSNLDSKIMEDVKTNTNAGIEKNDDRMIEAQGLLIDETRSIAGRNFLTAFTQNFNETLGERSVITITELADPIRGSSITITVDDSIAFQAPLNPRQDTTDELAASAAGVISEFIINKYTSPDDLSDLSRSKSSTY